eukprot:Opistho-1_new@32025
MSSMLFILHLNLSRQTCLVTRYPHKTKKTAATKKRPRRFYRERKVPDCWPKKNIHNTEHIYTLVEGTTAIEQLVATLLQQTEICFDTETTNIDANEAELVGLSFSYKKGEGFYIPCPADQQETKLILDLLE